MILAPFLCIVTAIPDGDTIICRDQGSVRIANISTCETRGRERELTCGRVQAAVAKAHLAGILARGSVVVVPERPCSWRERRIVGRVLVHGRDVAPEMVRDGGARVFVCKRGGW